MASDTSDPDAIQHLDSEIIEDNTSLKLTDTATEKAPVRHRMHRSAVRPFLCCGSEISLVSLVDTFDVHAGRDSSHVSAPVTAATPLTASADGASCSGCRRSRKRTEKVQQNKSKKKFWSLRGKLGNRFVGSHNRSDSGQNATSSACAAHRKRSSSKSGAGSQSTGATGQFERMLSGLRVDPNICVPIIDISRVNFDALYPTRDLDEIRREERAREIEEGIDISGTRPRWSLTALVRPNQRNLVALPTHILHSVPPAPTQAPLLITHAQPSTDYEDSIYGDTSLCLQALAQRLPSVFQTAAMSNHHPAAHSQVEFIHCLVPELREITKCSFYWGVMDRYEAETLLENKPEGTFLLRDSAQEEFLFSVSFRRYNRSLHARIEQWNHLFSFDAHDPAVFACDSVVGLIEHYKDPECCMFFEPMLTLPLNRTSCFPLKHLCRSEICSNITYDHINLLPLPSSMKEYLKYYHYKQKVRMKRLDIAS